jgi:predicted enzyme related to lactoylglutathione lyase
MPDFANGKICYIEIPATNVQASADFYSKVFGWKTRTRSDGSLAFDDGVGQVSGTWRTGREPAQSGMIVYIMVTDIEGTIAAIRNAGGEITQPVGADHPEVTARFRDPGGNILGLYEQRGIS